MSTGRYPFSLISWIRGEVNRMLEASGGVILAPAHPVRIWGPVYAIPYVLIPLAPDVTCEIKLLIKKSCLNIKGVIMNFSFHAVLPQG